MPDLPISPHPNYVTPQGLATLQSRLAARQADLQKLRARAERLDKQPEAAAMRDIRYLEARLRSAIVIDPARQALRSVAFGLAVTVQDEAGQTARYQITGEDEADAGAGRIAPQSPLTRALLGAEIGDEVIWRKPSGDLRLIVTGIDRP
ncbi:GreA/GreB family elongation factor [Tabrizicola sp.]|uniref:GreA/GreB family elongation factor n=1 Tax=Tabrizicola sp. TaxID=2005166 RepID=UPI00286B68D4|nr:GreA/GreB family elongation factor [Tabrizicola sp.]